MTPTAITPAGRGTRDKPPRAGTPNGPASGNPSSRAATPNRPAAKQTVPGPRAAGHRTELRRQPAPRVPRRVSGPAGGLTRGDPRVRPQRSAGRARTRSATTERTPLVVRWTALVRGLPDHPLLDRIIRGRAWIPLLGVLLAGIVAMQVEVLKLNASVGRSLERGTALQSRNELLRASVASLSDDQRIESMAARMGMVMPAPQAIKFLDHRQSGSTQPVLTVVHQPDVTSFVSQLALSDPASSSGAATASTSVPAGTASPAPPATTTPATTTPAATTPATTTAAVPAQTDQGATGSSGSGGGVAPSSGGAAAGSTGT
jgi:hypothetical protein